MRLPDDDELYEVDQTYLGPPGRYIAPMRHRAIFAFLVIAPLSAVLLRKVGMPMTLLTVGLWLLVCVYAAMKVADHLSPETPAAAAFSTLWHELTAPREDRARQRVTARQTYHRVSRPRRGWARAQQRLAGATTDQEFA